MKTKHLSTWTIEDLEALDPCEEALKYCRKHKTLSKAWDKCQEPQWMLWFLERTQPLTYGQAVMLACDCVERVLPVFEKAFPGDQRPRQAIEAARVCIKNQSGENKKAAGAAARAAWEAAGAAARAAWEAAGAAAGAAEAAGAAARAAWAAWAARAAAWAAGAAARAAWEAAGAAAGAAGAAGAAERKEQAKLLRVIVGNPFKP